MFPRTDLNIDAFPAFVQGIRQGEDDYWHLDQRFEHVRGSSVNGPGSRSGGKDRQALRDEECSDFDRKLDKFVINRVGTPGESKLYFHSSGIRGMKPNS
jgi:hypothetical protein